MVTYYCSLYPNDVINHVHLARIHSNRLQQSPISSLRRKASKEPLTSRVFPQPTLVVQSHYDQSSHFVPHSPAAIIRYTGSGAKVPFTITTMYVMKIYHVYFNDRQQH